MSDIACPKCNEAMQLDIAAAVGKDQKFSYRVYPETGSMMQAKAIGGQLTAMDDLMRACAIQDGGKVRTYIDRIETHKDGSIEFFLIVLPVVAWDAAKGKFVRSAPAKAMSARQGQDPKGLGATPASAVPEGDLPNTIKDQHHDQ